MSSIFAIYSFSWRNQIFSVMHTFTVLKCCIVITGRIVNKLSGEQKYFT